MKIFIMSNARIGGGGVNYSFLIVLCVQEVSTHFIL